MLTNNKIKFFAIGFLIVIASAFLFLKNQKNENDKNTTNQNDSQTGFSVVPKSNSELIAMHSPVLGPIDAPVTIVEFLDPECEACGAMYPIVKDVMKEFEGKVRLVIRYLPFHGNSMMAINILESARDQGKYWEALRLIFEKQDVWASHHDPKPEMIYTILQPLGLDMNKLKNAVKTGQFNQQIEIDKADGQKLGADKTPTFFVNGEQLYELGHESLRALITKKLK